MNFLLNISKRIDSMNQWIGEKVSWLSILLVLLICIDVLQRYFLDMTKKWIIELEWHLFAMIFLFGAAYTLLNDKHIRVDVFYQNFSTRKKAIVNILGTGLLLIPWVIVIIYTSYDYALNSFSYKEGSPDPGGLPARYIIKFCIPFAASLLLFQGISEIIKSVYALIRKPVKE